MSEDERRAGIGQRATDDGDRVSLLEQFMPHFDTRSQHAIEVQARAQVVFTAVETVRVKEVRFLRELEFIRALPRVAAMGRLDVPTVDARLVLSFTRGAALLGARPPEEILAGAIGRFWRLAGNGPVAFGLPEEFLTFTEPGFVKAVVGFRLDPRGAAILLTTETRFIVHCDRRSNTEADEPLLADHRTCEQPHQDGVAASDPNARASPPESDPGVHMTWRGPGRRAT